MSSLDGNDKFSANILPKTRLTFKDEQLFRHISVPLISLGKTGLYEEHVSLAYQIPQ